MSAMTSGEGASGRVPNPHDYMSSPRYDWLVEETDIFMGENPDVVAQMEQIAAVLVGAMEDDSAVVSQDILRLPDTVPRASRRKYPGSDADDPLFGLRLTLDRQVKHLSGNRYFVHEVHPTSYEAVRFPGAEEASYMHQAFGLIAVDDLRRPADYRPDFALVLSDDRKHAVIAKRVPDSERIERNEEEAIGILVDLALSMGGDKKGGDSLAIQDEVRTALLSREPSPRAERAIIKVIGADALSRLTAGREGRTDVEPVDVSDQLLRAVKILLEVDKSV